MTQRRHLVLSYASALCLFTMLTVEAVADPIEREHIEPVGDLYTQIVAVEANGVRTLYVSGQVSRGETLEEQSKGAYGRLKSRLEAAGASVDDIVKLVTYVVDWNPDKADDAFAGLYEIYADSENVPAHTLVGVKALYSPSAMLEVEAVAVVASE